MSSGGQTTSQVRQAVDVTKLESYLEEKKFPFTSPLNLRQFNLGQSNPTYLVTDDSGKKFVLRKKPPGELMSKKAHAVEREYTILDKLNKYSQVPVPKVYLLCEDTKVIGSPFYVSISKLQQYKIKARFKKLMEFVAGRIFTNVRLPEIAPKDKTEIWLETIDSLAKLHKVDIQQAQLQDHGKQGGFYRRQLEGLLKLSEIQSKAPNVKKLYRVEDIHKLFISRPIEDEASVVHGDYKLDNMIFSIDSNRVIGILDWELSTIGHPLFDLSNLLQPFYTKGLPHPDLPVFSTFFPIHDDPHLPDNFLEVLLKRYCHLTSRTYPIPNWDVCMAFSFFRLAVISQGVSARAARGQASSASASQFQSSNFFAELIFRILSPASHL